MMTKQAELFEVKQITCFPTKDDEINCGFIASEGEPYRFPRRTVDRVSIENKKKRLVKAPPPIQLKQILLKSLPNGSITYLMAEDDIPFKCQYLDLIEGLTLHCSQQI